jgi:hypothetical protein
LILGLGECAEGEEKENSNAGTAVKAHQKTSAIGRIVRQLRYDEQLRAVP